MTFKSDEWEMTYEDISKFRPCSFRLTLNLLSAILVVVAVPNFISSVALISVVIISVVVIVVAVVVSIGIVAVIGLLLSVIATSFVVSVRTGHCGMLILLKKLKLTVQSKII